MMFFPLVLFHSDFVVGGGSVLVVCDVCLQHGNLLLYVGETFVWYICETNRLSILVVSSAHLIENALIWSCQMDKGRRNEIGGKVESMPAWSAVVFMSNTLYGI